jgi:periplasmic protein TonB
MLKRTITALVAASAVTFALFFIMQMLVSGNDDINLESKGFKFIDVVQNIPEQEIRKREIEVEKPPEVETPPDDIQIKQINLDGPSGMDLSIGKDNMGAGIEMQGVDLSLTADGEYLPLVRMEPTYPRRAAERGIEGWVTVEFTVTADGTVADPFVIQKIFLTVKL